MTLKPLLRALDLRDDDPVGRELRAARERALEAGLASLPDDESPILSAVRHEFMAHLTHPGAADKAGTLPSLHSQLHRGAVEAARRAVLAMRANHEIGDDAFHQIEQELGWLEMAGSRAGPDGAAADFD